MRKKGTSATAHEEDPMIERVGYLRGDVLLTRQSSVAAGGMRV